MSDMVIGDYTAAVTVDGSTNYLLVQPGSSSTAYKKINRNVFLGVTGQPADISTIQTFTNKTLGNTNTITLKDTLFTLQDDGDTTKQGKFQLSGLTTATTRTYTMPDANTTLVGRDTVDTLTNKTFTAPVISGGSIDNSTITVDAIGEHTVNNGVTIDGLNIMNGALNSNNSVVTSNITDGAVTPAKLTAGTGSGWSWASFSPTWTNLTVGNGTVSANYTQIGKGVYFVIDITWGTTTSVSGSVSVTLPVTSVAVAGSNGSDLGIVKLNRATTGYTGVFVHASTTTGVIRWNKVTGTALVETNISSTSPDTWITGDEFHIRAFYQAA